MKKSIFLFFAAILCSVSAWANGGIGYKGVKFTKDGTTTGWYNIHNVTWDYANSSYECRSGKSGVIDFNNADLGIVTSLKLHSFVVIGWTDNSDWVSGQLKYRTYLQSASAGNYNVYNVGNYETYCNAVDVLATSGNNRVVGKNGTMDVTLVDNNTTPGKYYLQLQGMGRMRWCDGSFNVNNGSEVKASYTVPGFTTTSASQTFDNTTVNSNSSKTISFGTHYGTALTTSNCAISGTNKSEFSVTSINESGVTIKFAPTSAGSKSATLTITDAHGKTCTIELSGTAIATYTVTITNDGNGSTVPSGEQLNITEKDGIAISAEAAENFAFTSWTIVSGTGTFDTQNSVSTKFYPTSDATIQATFHSTITNSLSVVAGAKIESVAGSTDPIVLGESYAITATPAHGYKFNLWTAEPAENAAFDNASSATTQVKVQNGSVTVTASATEILSILTTANSYDAGNPVIAAPTPSATEIGIATTATVTATPATGYTLASWTLENCVRTDGGAENATTITIKSNGDGAAATVTANYEINKYYVVGSFNGWNTKDANYEMIYDNGVYKKEVTFAKDVEFKICNGSWDASWSYDNLKGVEYKELTKNNDEDKNIKITAEGTTTFTIVFNLSKHLITFEGLTNKYSYVLMGVDGDWDTGIELALNPDATNEYVLKNQIIRSATDAVKVVTLDAEGNTVHKNNTVKDGSVTHTLTNENIVLADGVYNFWFNVWDGIYIEKSAAEDITLTGVTKTIFNPSWGKKYTSLDLGENSIQILNGADAFGYGTYDVQAYLADDDITVAGFGTWEVVEGVETLTATLVDDEKTKVYNLTATVAAIETYNLPCDDAHYYKPNMMETIFVGEVDGETLTVSVESLVVGENNNVLGIYGETDFLAETVTISVSGLTTYVLTGAFKDATGNIYNVSMTATPLPKTPVVVENATYTEVDGDIIITGDWSGTELTVTLYGYATSDNVLYEEAEMETDDILAASTEVTLNKTADAFTITGEFIHGWEAIIYNVTISGTLPVPASEKYTRTVTPGYFGTICLPYGSEDMTGATFFETSHYEDGKVYLNEVTTLVAGHAYIFLANAIEIAVVSDGTEAVTPVVVNGLHGTFSYINDVAAESAADEYIIVYNNTTAQCELSKCLTGCWLEANRAYVVISEIGTTPIQPMPGCRRIGMAVEGENAETGFENIVLPEGQTLKAIVNGQLIIIRDGEMYNAQGQRL